MPITNNCANCGLEIEELKNCDNKWYSPDALWMHKVSSMVFCENAKVDYTGTEKATPMLDEYVVPQSSTTSPPPNFIPAYPTSYPVTNPVTPYQPPIVTSPPPTLYGFPLHCNHCYCIKQSGINYFPNGAVTNGEGPHRQCCKCKDVMAEEFLGIEKESDSF